MLANGNVAVATLSTGKITEFSPAGAIVREVKMPDVYPTNICFGGADMKTAYITLSDTGQLGVMQWRPSRGSSSTSLETVCREGVSPARELVRRRLA